jgi:predicted DNA-binding protein
MCFSVQAPAAEAKGFPPEGLLMLLGVTPIDVIPLSQASCVQVSHHTYRDRDIDPANYLRRHLGEPIVATLKKRIAVSLPAELEQALNELRDATGVAPASFVAEIMTQSVPMIRSITEAALEAKRNPSDAFRIMQRSMLSATTQVLNAQMELIDQETALKKTPKAIPAPKKARKPKSLVEEQPIEKPKRKRAAKAQ